MGRAAGSPVRPLYTWACSTGRMALHTWEARVDLVAVVGLDIQECPCRILWLSLASDSSLGLLPTCGDRAGEKRCCQQALPAPVLAPDPGRPAVSDLELFRPDLQSLVRNSS